MATPIKNGNDFFDDTAIAGEQVDPSIPAIAGGRFAVVWIDSDNDSSKGATVRGQIFSSTGSKNGPEFLVASNHAPQHIPRITGLAFGDFVVVWTADKMIGDNSGYAIRAQIFNSNGSKTGNEILVNTTTARNQSSPSVAADGIGRFMVTWTDDSESGGDTSGYAVRGQMFYSTGNKQGNEFLVNTTTAGNQCTPLVAASSVGYFMVVWNDDSQSGGDTSGCAVRGQVFSPDGTQYGSEFRINTTVSSDQQYPSVSALPSSRFVVVWEDYSKTGGDISGFAIRGQILNRNGGRDGAEFLVNTTISQSQGNPSITALAGGSFVAVWTDYSQSGGDTSGGAIRGQVFNPDGSKAGNEFLVNEFTINDQDQPAITALSNGGFVVAWTDYSSGGDSYVSDVCAQIFNNDGSKVGHQFVVNTTTRGYQKRPSIAAL